MTKTLGIGLGLRDEIALETVQAKSEIDFLEIIPENYAGNKKRERFLENICHDFTVIPHAVDFSFGSVHPPAEKYVKNIKRLIEKVCPPYWSEHISFSKTNAHDIGHLSPVPFSTTMVDLFCENIERVQDRIKTPLILENISYPLLFKGTDLDEPTFINLLCEKTGCGLLLDVTNLFVNAKNHGYNALAFLKKLNPDYVKQLHLIGYEYHEGWYFDTHGGKIQKDLWELYTQALTITNPDGLIIEWDKNFPEDFNIILNEVRKAREIWNSIK